jgi:hypothetical protein
VTPLPPLDDRLLYIFVLGPGLGESIVIRTAAAEWIIIDSFESEFGADDILTHYRAETAAVILTHPHMDHASGFLETLGRHTSGPIGCRPPVRGRVADNDLIGQRRARQASSVIETIERRWATEPATRFLLETRARLAFGEVRLTALWPPGKGFHARDLNHWSTPMLLTWGSLRVVLGADLPAGSWRRIPPALRDRLHRHRFLKIPHHGSRGSYHKSYARRGTGVPGGRTWVVTPWLLGGRRLPLFTPGEGIDKLLQDETEIWLTSPPSPLPAPPRDRKMSLTTLSTPPVIRFGTLEVSVRPRHVAAAESWVAAGFDRAGRIASFQSGDEALAVCR